MSRELDREIAEKVMGWVQHRAGNHWVDADSRLIVAAMTTKYGNRPFDPFTDANDDYAVLEWMRAQDTTTAVKMTTAHNHHWSDYQIGDYARAALMVIDDG